MGGAMLVSKLVDGVIIVQHGASRRAFRPRFVHRLLLAWVFRNFISLPVSVLAKWQKTLIAAVMAEALFIPVPTEDTAAIIGTVESATPTLKGKPVAPSADWEYMRRRAVGNRLSA
jgi:hypothetical protein